MLRRGNWRFGAALLVGLGASAALAGEPDFDTRAGWGRGPGLLNKLFSPRPQVEKKKPAPPPAKEAARKPPPVTSVASARSRELANYLRRMAVCDQLMQVAYDTKDEDLQRQVEQLKDRVWAAYQLGMERSPAGARQLQSDEQILDKHLGGKVSAKESTEELLLGSGPANSRAGRTALKEDKR